MPGRDRQAGRDHEHRSRVVALLDRLRDQLRGQVGLRGIHRARSHAIATRPLFAVLAISSGVECECFGPAALRREDPRERVGCRFSGRGLRRPIERAPGQPFGSEQRVRVELPDRGIGQ